MTLYHKLQKKTQQLDNLLLLSRIDFNFNTFLGGEIEETFWFILKSKLDFLCCRVESEDDIFTMVQPVPGMHDLVNIVQTI